MVLRFFLWKFETKIIKLLLVQLTVEVECEKKISKAVAGILVLVELFFFNYLVTVKLFGESHQSFYHLRFS
jgi:hypothetical protein